MTFFELLKSYKYCIEDNLKIVNRYRKLFKNYLHVIINVKRRKFPIKCKMRKGGTKNFNKHFEIMNTVFAEHYGILYDMEKDILSGFIKNPEHEIKLYGGEGSGDAEVFLENQYSSLPVKEKVVVDIGANIGDSAIYFLLHGAKKVFAIEPYPKNYETAQKNIDINHLTSKVHLLLAGCSAKHGYITIDQKIDSGNRSVMNESTEGKKIPLITLEEIMHENDMDSAVLKIDCEGCEYDVILNSSKIILRNFIYIHIEYHYGYKNLKEKLEKCGFEVFVTNPRYSFVNNMYVGYLTAERH